MALQLVLGPSGSGKTHFLYEYALNEAEKNRNINYLIIVPEQFTLSTQKELIRMSKNHGILNVDVLSFNRLAYRIFEEVGFKDITGDALDDMGKNLILRHIAAKNADKLTVFAKNMTKLGYITEVKSQISEFKQYGISPDRVEEMMNLAKDNGKGLLNAKLNDVKILYDAFNEYISDKYITTEEVLERASRVMNKSKKLQKSVVIFDGFTGFTPVQYGFIESLLKITRDIKVSILYEKDENGQKSTYNKEHELFYLGYTTRQKLNLISKNNDIKIEEEIVLGKINGQRYLNGKQINNSIDEIKPMLNHLEKNIFRTESKKFTDGLGPDSEVLEQDVSAQINDKITHDTQKSTKAVGGEIGVFSALQPVDEVTRVAVEIEKLIRLNKNIRYNDIAIATGDMENYIPQFKRVFSLYNIPYFIDKSQPVLLNPFIEFVRSIIDIVKEDYSYNAVLRYLRSPLSGYNSADIDVFDNFILARGIKGISSYLNSFAEKYGSSNKISGQYDLEKLDGIREKLLTDLKDIENLITHDYKKAQKIPTKLVKTVNAAIMRFFEALDIENRLEQLTGIYLNTDVTFEQNHKKEYEKIYSDTIMLFEKMDELLGDEKVTMEEYGQLVDAGFDEIRIGIIPTITDYIQIGDTTRSRFNKIKVLFIVGANDGILPSGGSSNGIISDLEKDFIKSQLEEIEFAPTAREKVYTGQLYMYMLMTKPTDRLYLSYSRLNNKSESIRPSYIIKVLIDMFPNLKVQKDDLSEFDYIFNEKTALNVVSAGIGIGNSKNVEENDISYNKKEEILKYLACKTDISLEKVLDAAFTTGVMKGSDNISKAIANILYGKALIGSVTRLEQYVKCAFKYYLTYGLSIKERELFNFETKDMGNVFHGALEEYAKGLKKQNHKWTDVSEEERARLTHEAVESYVESDDFSVLKSSFRSKYMIERMARIVDRSVDVMTNHLKAGEFNPTGYELSFRTTDNIDSFTFKLSEDEIMKLSGKVDRLDTYETDDKLYIKIIDYKSGNLNLDLIEIYKGLKLQLVTYLNAVKEISENEFRQKGVSKEIIPAGILYYHLDDPIVEGSSKDSDDVIADNIYKQLKMTGLVNSDQETIRLIDKDFESASDIIPVKLNRDKSLSKTSSAVSTEDFDVISKFVNKKIKDIGVSILSGDIKAEPHGVKGIDTTECNYCPYKSVCKFDENAVNSGSYGTTDENNSDFGANAGISKLDDREIIELMKAYKEEI